ncbi:MAG: hypothetical protein E7607_01870 [Ruminococcaceae bacterium]|nr:hypothetical protein [Oscillospiraceae bacterium]
MIDRVKKLMPPKDTPLLNMAIYDECIFYEKKEKKLKIIYRMYFVTAAIIAILCIGVIFLGKFNRGESLYQRILYGLSDNSGQTTNIDTKPSQSVNGVLLPSKDTVSIPNDKNNNSNGSSVTKDNIYDFDYTKVPSGDLPIVPMDLSLSEYGNSYIQNSTGLTPNTTALLNMNLNAYPKLEYLSSGTSPKVLIVHTHGTEAYSANGAISYRDDGSEIARTSDKNKNTVSVGAALAKELDKLGIKSIHCEIMHDSGGYGSAYGKAKETIEKYMKQYPTIELVIDIHRDAIIKSDGALVRPVTVVDGKAAAQIMCVVGSSWGGEHNPNWERNLALALQLRKNLNDKYENLCRPPYLKSSTYNQELAYSSLLLEIGACGNSLEEAVLSAKLVAKAISEIL